MDPVIAILITIVIGIISLLVYLGKSKKGSGENQQANEPGNGAPRRNLVAQRGVQRNQRNRLARGNRNQNADNFIRDEDDEEERVVNRRFDDDEGEDFSDEEREAAEREELRKKIGTKKLAKLEEKAAKKERNEQMLREREEKKERDEKIYQERKKREEEEERLEKEKEEAEKKAKEEQERKEHEEYLKLKAEFSIEEEGQDALLTEEDSQNLLLEFVNFIKTSKIVVLEDLASEFKLKTQDVINRINLVQEMGLLTGVMDDRGKFIYISEEELLKVKIFIEQRGRVNIAELAKSSNELINLKPSVNKELIEASAS